MYFFDALSVSLSNAFSVKGRQPAKYPEKPYEIFKHEKTDYEKEIEAQKEREKAIAFFNSLAKSTKNLGKH